MSKCPSWQAIYKGDAPLSTHLVTSVLIFLSNSFSTMSKCPSWQAIYKGGCFTGDPDLTRWILEHTVVDSSNSYKQQGETDVVNICRNNGVSPLVIACKYHHTEIVEMLLEYKADINKCTKSGESPYKGDAPLSPHLFTSVLILLSNSFSTMSKCPSWQAIYKGDAPLSTHLVIACKYHHTEIVEMLLEYKADINKCTKSGESPLYIACQEGHFNISLSLLFVTITRINNSMLQDPASKIWISSKTTL
jgi:hypothetical protein